METEREKKPARGEAPAPPSRHPNVFYFITLVLSIAIAATPFILAGIASQTFPSLTFLDIVASLTAGILFWTATMLGLVKSIRIFGCMAGGAIAGFIVTPLVGLLLWSKSSGQTPSAWIAMATFALAFSGTALVLWFVLGAVSNAVDKMLKKYRTALALDFFLGSAFGLALIMALSIVYSIAMPQMGYTSFWKTKAEEIQKEIQK